MIWRLCHDLKGEHTLCEELDDKEYHAKRLNAISKRLSRRLCKRLVGRLCKRFSGKLFRRSHVRVRLEKWHNAEESDLRSRLMAYSLARLRKSGEGCAGLLLWRLRLESIEGCDQKPLEAAITKLVDVKVITDGSEDA
nr:hypothetical protein [Tanacetum cinerariifolium]